MKVQIRHSIFETNSSSTHAIVILSDEEYKQYQNGELLMSRHGNFITEEEYNDIVNNAKKRAIKHIKEAWSNESSWDYTKLHTHYKTLEAALENANFDDFIRDATYEYDYENMDIIHTEKDVNGVKVHALSVYGYDY